MACLLWASGPLATAARAQQAEPPPAASPAAPDQGTAPAPVGWFDERRETAARGLGLLLEGFDGFFGDDRQRDIAAPTSRLRLRTYARTAEEERLAAGFGVSASFHLPRLEQQLRNARLVLVGEREQTSQAPSAPSVVAPRVEPSPSPPLLDDLSGTYLSRGRGRTEMRFDLIRHPIHVLDAGAGISFNWPLVPFARVRAHLGIELGAGLLLRGTQVLFTEFWGRGPGTSTDLELGRLFGPWFRLRWEGHGLFARRSRGVEWSTLIGAEWMVHRRTGLFATAGCEGFGTPRPGTDLYRLGAGVRRDLRDGWIFAGLEPELTWPRPAGGSRVRSWAVLARLELVLDSRPARAIAQP